MAEGNGVFLQLLVAGDDGLLGLNVLYAAGGRAQRGVNRPMWWCCSRRVRLRRVGRTIPIAKPRKTAMRGGRKSYFGYKDHIEIDAEHRLIRRYVVTDAAVWDGQVLGQLLDEDNDTDSIWGDSAYRSETIEAVLGWMGFESQIHERAYRNRPLSEDQTEHNREKSRIRARVEHVFWAWIMGMGGKFLRTIGLANAKVQLGLKNLTYNLIRFTWLETRAVKPASIAE